jgi:hypothetical protein
MTVTSDFFSELDAAKLFCQMWTQLECSELVTRLADDAVYSSQWTLNDLVGKTEITDYLKGKMQTLSNKGISVYTHLARASESYPGKVCACLSKEAGGVPEVAVIFEVSDTEIKSINLCDPSVL